MQESLLLLTAAALFQGSFTPSPSLDWEELFAEIHRQGLVSLTYPLIRDLEIPADIKKKWAAARDRYLMSSIKNIHCHFALGQLLSREKIPYVILKGIASGSYYPDYLARAYGDVDFLVPEERFEETADFLSARGFVFEGENAYHKHFNKDGMAYELHKNIGGLPGNETAPLLTEYLSSLIPEAVSFELKGQSIQIPNPRHHALSQLLHAAKHLRNAGLGLRHLCDWAVFADKMGNDFFEKEMQPILKKTGLWHFARLLTALCMTHLGLRPLAFARGAEPDHLARLLEEVFASGNFGRKKSREDLALKRYAAYKASGGRGGRLSYLLKMINGSALSSFPVLRKKPYWRPAGWLYVSFRYLLRLITGKRSAAYTRNLMKEDASAKNLLEDWRLFKAE